MEQDRIHIKLARRTPEERQADETRRLDPFMRALKAIHTAATPAGTGGLPRSCCTDWGLGAAHGRPAGVGGPLCPCHIGHGLGVLPRMLA